LIEIKDAERGSKNDPTLNKAADEMISASDLGLTKIRSFVNSGRDILKDIQKKMKETKSSLDQYKSSLDNDLLKINVGKKDLKVLSEELDLKKEYIINLHSEIDSLKQEIVKLKGEIDDERQKRAKSEEKNSDLMTEVKEIKKQLQDLRGKYDEVLEKNAEMSIYFESQKQKWITFEENSKKREMHDQWEKEAMILADFIFNLENSLKSKMKIKKNVKFTLKSIFYNNEEKRKTFERFLKDLNFSEYFDFEEEVVNLIGGIKDFAHFDKSVLKQEDLYAIAERNYGKDIGKMKAFDFLLKLEKAVEKWI